MGSPRICRATWRTAATQALRAPARALGPALALAISLAIAAPAALAVPSGLPYPIVYVRQPRNGSFPTIWTDVARPGLMEPGSDLMLLHPDGSEEILFDAGNGGVCDPVVSFDGASVYFALFHDLRLEKRSPVNSHVTIGGSDIYRIHVPTRNVERLTFGEYTPNTGAGVFIGDDYISPPLGANGLGYGVLNLGPCPIPGGRIAFTSSRNGFEPPRGSIAQPVLQLFVMDEDGANVECITPMTLSGALNPTILTNGRILFSTHENQGARDNRLWGVWSINPDGTAWDPIVSPFRPVTAFHWTTQMSSGSIVVGGYYNLSNLGFGQLFRTPLDPPAGEPRFHPVIQHHNPMIEHTPEHGALATFQMPFTPRGFHSLTPFTHMNDDAAPVGNDGATRVGKVTHPAAAPGDDMLVVWSPGPVNTQGRPISSPSVDSGIYVLRFGLPVSDPGHFVEVRDLPQWNEAFPRPLVRYSDIYGGVERPETIERLPNDGAQHAALPEATPYGLVGASSFYRRGSRPGQVNLDTIQFDGLDPFNFDRDDASGNWRWQGSDAGLYSSDDIWAVRIVMLEPNTHRGVGPFQARRFNSHAGERMRILGEIPLRKTNGAGQPILDPVFDPDTSFLARIPADTPFLFQTLDRDGLVLNAAQTWHQVRPGEMRTNCGGCHSHANDPVEFDLTAAGQPGYEPFDLTESTPLIGPADGRGAGAPTLDVRPERAVDVEFLRDIRPILVRSCVQCHTKNDSTPPGALVLDDLSPVNGLPGDYVRLANDPEAQWGHAPLVGSWRQTNASRYVRKFQSRRSLLTWKVFGRRLDGWSNSDHPTESVPGNLNTLPKGANPGYADIDFTGTIMPPPGSGVPALSGEEKMTIARWIDLGCPIDIGPNGQTGPYGWFHDDLRPTLAVATPQPGRVFGPLTELKFGVADAYSGVDFASFRVSASIEVAGRSPGADLGDLITGSAPVYAIPLNPPLLSARDAKFRFEARDLQGNATVVERTITLTTPSTGDLTGDGAVNSSDLALLLAAWGEIGTRNARAADINGDDRVNSSDLARLLTLWTRPARGDINGDGAVDSSDLAILLGAWRSKNPLADLNGDGSVNSSDLGILLGAWGAPKR